MQLALQASSLPPSATGVSVLQNSMFDAWDNTVELQWLEHLWDYENLFEARVVRAIVGLQ